MGSFNESREFPFPLDKKRKVYIDEMNRESSCLMSHFGIQKADVIRHDIILIRLMILRKSRHA